jgi:hypothetical protein
MTDKQKELIAVSKDQFLESIKTVSAENQNNYRAFYDLARLAIHSSFLMNGGAMAGLLYNARYMPDGWLTVFAFCALSTLSAMLSLCLAVIAQWIHAKEYDKKSAAAMDFSSRFIVSLIVEYPAGQPYAPHESRMAKIFAYAAGIALGLSLLLSFGALFVFLHLG